MWSNPSIFGSFVTGTLCREGEGRPAIVDAGLEAPGGKDAADLPRVITGVPVVIEVGLNLVRHGFHPGFVPIGKGGAEGRQLRIGAEFAGLVKLTALFRAAIGELDEIDGNAAHVGLLWVGEHPGSPAPRAASPQKASIVSR
jgi:hypothetical protein